MKKSFQKILIAVLVLAMFVGFSFAGCKPITEEQPSTETQAATETEAAEETEAAGAMDFSALYEEVSKLQG